MAVNGTAASTQPLIPFFKGENYEFWSIKLRTLFMSQKLWDLGESGYNTSEEDEQKLCENKKKDARAWFFLQQAVSDEIFSRFSVATTSKAHEDRLNKSSTRIEEKAFQVKGESSHTKSDNKASNRSTSRGGYRGRGCGGSHGREGRSGERRQFKNNGVKCYYCGKMGHKEVNCWTNGFSNHMTGSKQLFKEDDGKEASTVRLGDDKVYGAEDGVTFEGSGWPVFAMHGCQPEESARLELAQMMKQRSWEKYHPEEVPCQMKRHSAFCFSGGVGESEYIVAYESSSPVTFSSLDTWIGDDGVGDSFLSSLEDFLLPVALGGCLLCFTFIFFLEGPSPGSLLGRIICERTCAMRRSFTPSCPRMISPEMPPLIFFTAFSYEYTSMEMGSLVEYLLNSPSFRPIHMRKFFIIRSIFFPLSINFQTITPSRPEKERFT
ncbi:DUF4219 domain-containing protein [Senna tora]|uniref:DUF4219 domain-containing protein n=1 Tax=Senna tora TaxID=362788 RepID=A0A834SE75_9FABA|nr:DUF4219 domain-containing protein [Senna tora]